jgi:2,4-dienoyl-CoA reductase-like NADH-dependent reductase (Old Yellow Enzyme family)
MRYVAPGQHKDLASFRAHLRALDPAFDCDDELLGAAGPLGLPFQLGSRKIGNRFAIHPMEGWDGTAEGLPSELTLRRWRRFGESGAKLVWGGEAFAVREDGRANPRQLYLDERAGAGTGLAQLLAAIRSGHASIGASTEDLFVGLQLTHSGRFARPRGALEPVLAAHVPPLDRRFGIAADARLASDGELEAIGERFVVAARLALEVGFDFVDVKCCHGYLLHELLGARSRPGPYGGSFENRTRLFRRIVEAIRRAAPGLEIGVRVSIADLFPHAADPETGIGAPLGLAESVPYAHGFGLDPRNPLAFDLAEPFAFLALARSLGIRLFNLTLGSPYYTPHLQRPAAYPPSDGYQPPEDPLASVLAHLRVAREAKHAFPDLAFVGTGYTYLQEWLPHVAQHEVGRGHVDFVGLGRMALVYPELPRDVLAGRPLERRKLCRTFSDCTTAPRYGLVSGCYPLDPHYRALPEASRVREIKAARREDSRE